MNCCSLTCKTVRSLVSEVVQLFRYTHMRSGFEGGRAQKEAEVFFQSNNVAHLPLARRHRRRPRGYRLAMSCLSCGWLIWLREGQSDLQDTSHGGRTS